VKTISAIFILLLFIVASAAAQSSQPQVSSKQAQPAAQTGPSPGAAKRIEAYLRRLYAWGPDFKLTFSPFRESPIPGLYEVTLELSKGDQKDSAVLYVTRDGQYLVRGELTDITKDPLAENLAQLHLEDSPSTGPQDAQVTVVEFADFECPACGQLHAQLQSLLQQYPQVRFVYKDYPLSQIHPWAQTAALAGRCVYNQDAKAFWKFHDALYDNQTVISAENAWDKMLEYATVVGVDPGEVRTCMNNPEAARAIDQNYAQGQKLGITSTPTLFVNGRRMVGTDINLISQFILYDLNAIARPAKAPTP